MKKATLSLLAVSVLALSGCESNTYNGFIEDFGNVFPQSKEEQLKIKRDSAFILTNEALYVLTQHAEEAAKINKKDYKSYATVYGSCYLDVGETLTIESMYKLKQLNSKQFNICKKDVDDYMTGKYDSRMQKNGPQTDIIAQYAWANKIVFNN